MFRIGSTTGVSKMAAFGEERIAEDETSAKSHSKLRLLLLSLIGGANAALLMYCVSEFLPEQYHCAMLIGSFVLLWFMGAQMAVSGISLTRLCLVMVGLFWGFLLALSAAVSIQNQSWSVNLVPLIIVLLLSPCAAVFLQLPLCFFRNRVVTYSSLLSTMALLMVLSVATREQSLSLLHKTAAPEAEYDIAAQAVSISPEPVVAGTEFSISYTIRNVGSTTIPASSYEVEFYLAGNLISFDRRTSTLHPAHSSTYCGQYDTDLPPGVHEYALVVDPGNTLPEMDEMNNTLNGSFVVVSQCD